MFFLPARADTGDTADCQDWRPDYEYVDGQCVDTEWESVVPEGSEFATVGPSAFGPGLGLVACAPGSDVAFIGWAQLADVFQVGWYSEDGVLLGSPVLLDGGVETCCDGQTGVPQASIGIPTPRCLAPVPVRDPELLLYGECNPDPEGSGCATVSSPAVGGAVMSLGLLVLLGWRRE